MSVFDPLGFLINFTVKGKILFQDIWRAGLEWDDALTSNLNKRWIEWMTELKKVTTFSISRCYVPRYNQSTELHIFCDASSKAFAAVAYLRIEENINDENIFVHTSFVMAKSRVSPLRPISIPRLELQAALLGSRLAKTVQENHSIIFHKVYYWTDSKTVISWIRSDARKFKPFVAHRLGEIDEITDVLFWNWIPTSENIADEATRDNLVCDLTENSRWMKGPNFLKEKKETWNLDKNKSHYEVDERSEIKREYDFIAVITSENKFLECLPNIERFSSWLKLIRSTAWILRIVEIKNIICKKKNKKLPVELYPEEIFKAEMIWIKNVQNKDFLKEITCLKRNSPINKCSQIYNLTPFLDDHEILRVKGRTEKSKDQEKDAKYPMILHPKNYFTCLLIHHYHLKAGHNGQNFVANELRQKYWILNLRAAVRRTWNNCQYCKNVRSKPCEPQMAAIPSQRLESFVTPFTNTGMDFFGPMEITVGRRKEKRYGVLFTCLSTRAVHLEVTNFINTDSTILAIRRFIGRRACPKRIYSDNGSNLHGSDKEIRKSLEELDQKQMINLLTTRGIEWHFIPPITPHMGGSWERLIKSVKIALKSVLKEQAPKEEVLQTLFVEAESIVNSRPLVHVSLDHMDDEALTPNHFLIGTSSNSPVWGNFKESDLINRKQWRKAQYFSNLFWKRWVHEYLPTLTRRTKWYYHDNNTAKVGDVVIIVDKDLPRSTWPKGIIKKVFPGADGKVRTVDVKTNTGVYRRPVVKLCILDLK